jgi:hypothetical protein
VQIVLVEAPRQQNSYHSPFLGSALYRSFGIRISK